MENLKWDLQKKQMTEFLNYPEAILMENFYIYHHVLNVKNMKKIIHSIFSKYRIRETEYFEVSFDVCKNAIDSISMISNAIYENMEHIVQFNLSSKIEKLVDEFKRDIKKNKKINNIHDICKINQYKTKYY